MRRACIQSVFDYIENYKCEIPYIQTPVSRHRLSSSIAELFINIFFQKLVISTLYFSMVIF